jgi:hypothetical protein
MDNAMIEETELKVGGFKFKGIWIAVALSVFTPIAGGIWATAEFYGRIVALEETVSGTSASNEKLTKVGANLESIMESQKELLDLRDRIADIDKLTSSNDVLVQEFKIKVNSIDTTFDKLNKEIDDIWRGMDALSNPLK